LAQSYLHEGESALKVCKNLSLVLLAAGLLSGAAAASNAQAFSLYNDNTFPASHDWSLGVKTTTNPKFENIFFPFGGGSAVSYGGPSTVVKFGDTQSFGPTTGSGKFTNVLADFTFDIANGAGLPSSGHHFTVEGKLNGSIGYSHGAPVSTTHVTFSSMVDTTGGLSAVLGTDPNDGLKALEISNDVIGHFKYTIWLDQVQNISAPGTDTTSITGFVNVTAVPELSSCIGMGLMVLGGGFLGMRSRRRTK
jgi:hypothetical protein